MRLGEKRKLGLVLSGGGIKAAAFHVGVCLALAEKGFRFAGGTREQVEEAYSESHLTFKTYVGSSAGAMVSSILASGHPIESLMDAFEVGTSGFIRRRSPPDHRPAAQRLKPISYTDIFSINGFNIFRMLPRALDIRSHLVTGGIETLLKNGFKVNGLFTTRGLEAYIRRNVVPTNQFKDLGVALYIIATQLNHSRKVIFGAHEEATKEDIRLYADHATISQAVAASTSLPPVFAPYPIRNNRGKDIYFFDGEIRDTLSTHVAADHGCDLVVASYSIQPYHYNNEMGSLHNYGIPLILNQALYQVVEQKIQKHIQHQQDIKAILQIIEGYFKQADLPTEHRNRLIEVICQRIQFRPNVEYIYIHPSPQDYEMFFVDHFSLNQKILARIVKIGFKAAISALRRYNV